MNGTTEKNRQNLTKHGIAFEEAALISQSPILSWIDSRAVYGETRMITSG